MPQSYSPCLLSQAPRAKKQRRTHVTAVFSAEWNMHFSPRNVRSRRRRFPNSGETISGFTAIFCDDWKDDMSEEEVIDDYVWPSKREREEDVEFFAQHWDSSQPSYKRQRLESPIESVSFLAESPEPQLSPSGNSPLESLSFTAPSPESQILLYVASPKPQIYQFDEFESEKWPSPPGDLECNVDARLMDSSEEKLLTPDIILPEDLIRDVTTLGQPPDLDIADLDSDIYPALISDEAENSSTAVTNLNYKAKTSNGILHSCEEVSGEQWSQIDDSEMEPEGFEFWDDFMKCCMGVLGDHKFKECQIMDAPQEPRFELCFEEMIDC